METSLPILLPPQPKCTACDLHTEASHAGVPSEWWPASRAPAPSSPALIVLGMNPGRQEDIANQPFIGRSGLVLRQSYLAGVPTLPTNCSIYFLNSARCYSSRKPPARHLVTCFNLYSIRDFFSIGHFHDTVHVLLLGAEAVSTFNRCVLDRRGVRLGAAISDSGSVHRAGSVRFTLSATYHPAFVLRRPQIIHAVNLHMQLLAHLVLGHVPPRATPVIIPPRSPRP